MKKTVSVEIEIDDAAVAVSVQDIMATLTPDQQLSIARDVVREWFAVSIDAERQAFERAVVDQIRAQKDRHDRAEFQFKTESEIRESWPFRDRLKEFKTVREKVVLAASEAMTKALTLAAEEVVKTDPTVLRMIDAGVAAAKEAFPAMLQSAMLVSMAERGGEYGQHVVSALREQGLAAWKITHEAIRKAAERG